MQERKYYIDNLRWIDVILLFPFHTFIIYNTFGDGNYVTGNGNVFLSNIIVSFWPWFMPLLFVLSGISAKLSLENRKPIDYLNERLKKILIPLFFGVLLLIPIMSYFGDCFHNGYSGNYFQHYKIFFTKWTDLTGYDGGFSPGHLWFILYLWIISIFAFPIILLHRKVTKKIHFERLNIVVLLLIFIVPFIVSPVLDIGGKSIGKYFAYYMIGYCILSDDIVVEKCKNYYIFLIVIALMGMAFILTIFNGVFRVNSMLYKVIEEFYAFNSILALLGVSKKHLDKSTKAANYFSKSSFSVYLFHFPWIVIVAYFTFKFTHAILLQVFVILVFSIILTFVSNEILRRIKITKIMFCLK